MKADIYKSTQAQIFHPSFRELLGEISSQCRSSSLNGSGNPPDLMLNCCKPFFFTHPGRQRHRISNSREEIQFAFLVSGRPKYLCKRTKVVKFYYKKQTMLTNYTCYMNDDIKQQLVRYGSPIDGQIHINAITTIKPFPLQ